MKHQWLQQSGSERLLVVFGGWALGSMPFDHLTARSDVLLLSDYRELNFPVELIKQYRDCSLLAYSFGIAAAGHALTSHPLIFARKIAVCGSLFPCDVRRGIAQATVKKMADDLSEQSLQHFAQRAGSTLPQTVDLAALKQQLYCTISRGDAPDLGFDTIWLCRKDRIFMPKNLQQAWRDQADKVQWLDAGHNPFPLFKTWEALLA